MMEYIGDWAPAYIGAIVAVIVFVIMPARFIYLWAIGRKAKSEIQHKHHLQLAPPHTEEFMYWKCSNDCPWAFEVRWDRRYMKQMLTGKKRANIRSYDTFGDYSV